MKKMIAALLVIGSASAHAGSVECSVDALKLGSKSVVVAESNEVTPEIDLGNGRTLGIGYWSGNIVLTEIRPLTAEERQADDKEKGSEESYTSGKIVAYSQVRGSDLKLAIFRTEDVAVTCSQK